MTEPDFEQIAREINRVVTEYARTTLDLPEPEPIIIAALRQIWNARGAADLKAVDVEAHRVYAEANRTGREDLVIDTVSAIKALDR